MSGSYNQQKLDTIDPMADPGDFCRTCRGEGMTEEMTERGTMLYSACRECRGTGLKTVRLFSLNE